MSGILSTPFIIQLNGYFAIVTARVAGKRGIQNKPSGQPIPELKKDTTPFWKVSIKTLTREEIG